MLRGYQAKLHARKVTTSELLSIRKTTILVVIRYMFYGFVQQFGYQEEIEMGCKKV